MLENMFEEAKQASYTLMNVNTDVKDKALESIAKKLDDNRAEIKEINKKRPRVCQGCRAFKCYDRSSAAR